MKNTLLSSAVAVLLATPVIAATDSNGGHGNGHGNGHGTTHGEGHTEMMQAGYPGTASDVERAVTVTMKETDDGEMIFEPSNLSFQEGQTVKFEIKNGGELEHEFILDTAERNQIHKEVMAGGSRTHASSNAVTLQPGEKSEIIWTFSNNGSFEFACLIPGHYESGMFGKIAVQ